MDNKAFLALTRLVEEVPGVPENDRYYIWHDHKTAWRGPTKQAGEEWAAANGIAIQEFEPFEP